MLSTLVRQLYDRDGDVRNRALHILDECLSASTSHSPLTCAVCEDHAILMHVMELQPAILHLKDAGSVVLGRFMSYKRGFESLLESGYLHQAREFHRLCHSSDWSRNLRSGAQPRTLNMQKKSKTACFTLSTARDRSGPLAACTGCQFISTAICASFPKESSFSR
jgi:hypothetical protein